MFAGAWSACYIAAFGVAASLKKVTLPPDYSVEIQVDVGQTGPGWFLGAHFTIRVPGLDPGPGDQLLIESTVRYQPTTAFQTQLNEDQTLITQIMSAFALTSLELSILNAEAVKSINGVTVDPQGNINVTGTCGVEVRRKKKRPPRSGG